MITFIHTSIAKIHPQIQKIPMFNFYMSSVFEFQTDFVLIFPKIQLYPTKKETHHYDFPIKISF